jgi:hypothetical protein
MDFGKRLIIVASLWYLSALWCATVSAGPPPVPTKIFGTLAVDGVQIAQDLDDGYIITVTRQDGSAFIPYAEDADGLSEAHYYIITIPIYDAQSQPDGASPGDMAVMHVLKDGKELFIQSPADGMMQVGTSGAINRIDINAASMNASTSSILLSTSTTTIAGGGGGGGGSHSTTTTLAAVTTSTTIMPISTTSTTTTVPECLNDGDCDDGSFCNGKETCVDGICVDGQSPCVEDQVCNDDKDECRNTVLLTATCLPATIRRPLLFQQRCTWLLLYGAEKNSFNVNSIITFFNPSGKITGVQVNPDRTSFTLGNFIFLPICIQKDAVVSQVTLTIINEVHISETTIEERIETKFNVK